MSWINDIAEYIEDEIDEYSVATNIYIEHMPPTPSTCIAIYSAGGRSNPHGVDTPWEEFALEIRVRASNYAAAETLMASVNTILDHKQAIVMNGSLNVQWVRPVAPYALLERDKQSRAVFLGRYVLQARRSAVYTA
jgi:hypothetical protein